VQLEQLERQVRERRVQPGQPEPQVLRVQPALLARPAREEQPAQRVPEVRRAHLGFLEQWEPPAQQAQQAPPVPLDQPERQVRMVSAY